MASEGWVCKKGTRPKGEGHSGTGAPINRAHGTNYCWRSRTSHVMCEEAAQSAHLYMMMALSELRREKFVTTPLREEGGKRERPTGLHIGGTLYQ